MLGWESVRFDSPYLVNRRTAERVNIYDREEIEKYVTRYFGRTPFRDRLCDFIVLKRGELVDEPPSGIIKRFFLRLNCGYSSNCCSRNEAVEPNENCSVGHF